MTAVNMKLSAGLDMFGQVDDVFSVGIAARTYLDGGGYDQDGIWQDGVEQTTTHKVTVQPLSDRESQSMNIGGDRVKDYRKIYINDGSMGSVTPRGQWSLPDTDGVYETLMTDNRPTRNYCKVIVSRIDA